MEGTDTRETVLAVHALRKRYGSFTAVDGVSFEVRAGEILGLLGPNGAGKTTTLECVEGLRTPEAGRIRVCGLDPQRDGRRVRRLTGVQLQTSGLPATMTTAEALRFVCAYQGVEPRQDLLERLGLGELRGKRFGEMSTGQQRRLALALAIVHRPRLLFLDEPTAGLDVGSRAALHAIMAELREQGTAIVLATHDMAEAEKMADRIAIVLAGRIVAEGTPREITAAGGGLTKVTVATERGSLASAEKPEGVVRTGTDGEALVFMTQDAAATVRALLAEVERAGDTLVDLRVERPSLEERFLEITKTEAAA